MLERLTLALLEMIDWASLWGGRVGLALCAAFYLFGVWCVVTDLLKYWRVL